MKRILLLCFFAISIFTSVQVSFAQIESANEYLDRKGEVYFQFQVSDPTELLVLTKIISIDNVKGNDVWAYANRMEFEKFLLKGIPYTVLPHPGDGIVDMWDNTKGIWDFDTYPTYSQYESMMVTFATNFPTLCHLDTIATLISGHRLLCLKITDNPTVDENEPEYFYSGGMHGDEITGSILLLRLADYLLDNYGTVSRVTNIVNNIELWICPFANPDGTYAGGDNTVTGATRYNDNNVDLNRNYPDPRDGLHPDGNAWQQETVAFMAFADAHDFVMGGNFHGGASVVNYPWDTWTSAGNPIADNSWWAYVSKEYADTAMAYGPAGYFQDVVSSGYTEGGDWYVITGGRQDYMNWWQHCREVTLEISVTKTPTASTLPNYWNYNYRSMLNYLEQCRYGVHGIITDACSGLPVQAKVYVNSYDQANDSSHVYSSLPVGNYHRPIIAGTYSITFSATGYQSQTITGIAVTNKNTTIRDVQLTPNPPTANFSATPTSGCIATVDFTDLSGAAAGSTYLWSFGDGQTSTLQNPSHSYLASGTYSVTLTVNSCAGNDSEIKTNYITITLPTAPTTTPAERCGPGSVSLSASGSGTLNWYDASSGGNLVNTGSNYTTPSLASTTTYYVEDYVPGTVYQNGGNTQSNSNGAFFTASNQHYLVFNCISPVTLVSVEINAQSAQTNKTISLQNSSGTTLQSTTVSYPAGISTLTLNFNIPVGTGLRLVGPGSPYLWRNDAGCSYPYNIGTVISITQSSATTNPTSYYYYFYKWQVEEPGCSSARTPVTATIKTVPTANAGNDVTITQGNSTTLTATGGGTYLWSTTETTASITVTPATTTTYTVTVTGANGCIATDDVIVTVNASTLSVTASANPQNICIGSSTQLNAAASGGSGYTYSWSSSPPGFTSTLQNPTATPTVTTTYTVTVTSGASTATSTTTVNVNSLPVANAGTDATICSGNSTTLTATGGTSYVWSNGAGSTATVTVTPASTTTYTVTVTNAAGCTATDNVLVTVNSNPVANAGVDDSVCLGGTAVLTATGGGTYLWSHSLGTTATVNASPAATTVYTVTVTGANGCTASDNVTVTVNSLPVVTISGNTSTCSGNPTTLTASGGITYLWSDGLGTNASVSVNPVSDYTYYVTVTDANGCSNTGSVLVTLSSTPVADAGTNQTICSGASVNLTASGGSTYEWSHSLGNTATVTATPTATTTYTVTVTNAAGCTDTDDVLVTVNAAPVAYAGADESICLGESVILTATGGGTYLWSHSLGSTASVTASPTTSTMYTVTVTGTNGCTASDKVNVTVNALPVVSVSGNFSICPGVQTVLTASGGVSYSWSDGLGTNPSVSVSPVSDYTYYVTATDANGCSNSSSANITLYDVPVADAGSDQTITQFDNTTLNGQATGGSGTYSYEWGPPAYLLNSTVQNPQTTDLSSTTVFTVTVTDDVSGCTSTDQVIVIVAGGILSVTAGANPTQVCAGSSIQLNALTSGGTGIYTYTWTSLPPGFSSTEQSPTDTPAMNSVYFVTVNDGTGTTTSSVSITVLPAPVANAGSDISACPGNTVTLTSSAANAYYWSTGATSMSIDVTANSTQTYSVTVTAANGCTDSDDVTVTAYTAPVAEAGNNQTICEGNTATLTATGGVSYFWSDGAGSTASVDVSPASATTYTVTVEDANGCTATDQVTVNVNPLPIPSFTFVTNELNVVFTNTSQLSNSYMWYFGDGGLSNQANPNYNYAAEGIYTVMLISYNSCGSDTAFVDVEVTLVGYQTGETEQYIIYPNPATGQVFVRMPDIDAEITITDLAGRIVLKNKILQSGSVSLDGISTGIYNVNITYNNSVLLRTNLIVSE